MDSPLATRLATELFLEDLKTMRKTNDHIMWEATQTYTAVALEMLD
jgi:hypothetical protein